MVKRLFLLSLVAFALGAQAQYQVGNSDFESWGSNDNEPGNGWYSFVSARTDDLGSFMGPMAIAQSKENTKKILGRGNSGNAVQLLSKSTLIGAKANGNLTTGRINMGDTSPGSEKNYNFTDRNGSNHAILTGHPDAFEYWAKFKRGETGTYNARCHVILHGECDYKDPSETEANKAAYLIAEATVYATPCTDWTPFSGELDYTGVTSTGKTYVLASFTTNPTAGGSANDVFDIDDIRFVYYSQLKSLTVNGVSVPNFDKDTYDYTVDAFYTSSTSIVAKDNTKKGVAKIDVTSEGFGYDVATAKYKIKVINEEGTENHIYTIQFKDSGLSDLSYDGSTLSGFSESMTSYNLSSEVYNASKLSYSPKGSATAAHSYNPATGVLTITVTGASSVTNYTIQFNDATLSDLSYDGTTLSGFSTSKVNYNLSTVNYDKTKVSYIVNGSATATTNFDYETGLLTISVTGDNSVTNYTIQFGGPLAASSKTYTEDLYVTVDGNTSDKQEASVTVQTLDNGKINFVLKNFILGGMMPIGNIAVEGIEVAADNTFSLNDVIQIAAGDLSVSSTWYGPMLPPVPLDLKGKFIGDSHIAVSIDIDMTSTLNQMIYVHLGYERYEPGIMAVNADAKYGTFCAPFAVEIPSGVQVYTVPSVSSTGLLTLSEVTGTIPANTPVVLYSELENGYISPELFGVAEAGTPKEGLLTGVYEATPAPVGSYVLQNLDNKVAFYQVATGQQPTVPANRCYLTAPASGVKALAFPDGTLTSISAIQAADEKAVIYDLSGRRVSKATKGIYIINGKKVIK